MHQHCWTSWTSEAVEIEGPLPGMAVTVYQLARWCSCGAKQTA